MSDEELRSGQAAVNQQGLPKIWSGGFADVYKIECPETGNVWALKCFTRETPDQRERYREISAHLTAVKLPFTVDFQYLESGIRVGGRWHPALKMRWIEGLTLNEFVEKYVDQPKTLDQLLKLWPRLARRLRKARVVHADLQHGNILLAPMPRGQLALKLIDYDGMYVPGLANRPSGEVGHAAYQHPQRLREGIYSNDVDRFPQLAIYCAIRCLTIGRRSLWRRFNNGDNLLFRESDFVKPKESRLFRELWSLSDDGARDVVARLVLACLAPLEESPLLEELALAGLFSGRVTPLGAKERAAVDAMLAPKPKRVPIPEAVVAPPIAVPEALKSESGSEMATPEPTDGVISKLRRCLGKAAGVLPGSLLAFDQRLSAIVGEENTILRGFVRTLLVSVLVAIIVSLGWFCWGTHSHAAPAEVALAGGLDLGGGVKIEFVRIPAGAFAMGSDARDDEWPVHRVQITSPFWLGKYEVTQEQWQAVMANNPSHKKEPRCPVCSVAWNDCKAFTEKLNERFIESGLRFDLPTEAQWEYACRAGSQAEITLEEMDRSAWIETNSAGTTHPVGEKKPNAWGLYDMCGNVLEWCADWYDNRYYANSPSDDPTGPASGDDRVCRGGAWNGSHAVCQPDFRYVHAPEHPNRDCGFRILCRQTRGPSQEGDEER